MDTADIQAMIAAYVAETSTLGSTRDTGYRIESLLRIELLKAQIEGTRALTEVRRATLADESAWRAASRAEAKAHNAAVLARNDAHHVLLSEIKALIEKLVAK